MDIFAPSQHDRVRAVFCRARLSFRSAFPSIFRGSNAIRRDLQDEKLSARRALQLLLFLNIPGTIGAVQAVLKGSAEARRHWPSSFGARWITHYFPDTKNPLLRSYEKPYIQKTLRDWTQTWLLTACSTRPSRWYTLLTNSFVHPTLGHLFSNLAALWGFGTVCTRLPGMDAQQMLIITLGSSVCSSLALVLDVSMSSLGRYRQQWSAAGASGVVCTFAAIAAVGAPYEHLSFDFGVFEIRVSTWAFTALAILADLMGMTDPERHMPASWWQPEKELIRHAAHLGGVAFGLLYYLFILRRRIKQDQAESSTVFNAISQTQRR